MDNNKIKINKIKIYEDGNCFFRCIAIKHHSKLQECNRMKNGRCNSRTLFSEESKLADSLRILILNYIITNISSFNSDSIEDCPINWDHEDESLEEHLDRMSEPTEFAEILEIKAASKFLKINIKIFVINSQELNLVASFGNYADKLNLILDENEHYDYLLDDIPIMDDINESKNHTEVIYPIDESENNFCKPYTLKTTTKVDGYLIKIKQKKLRQQFESNYTKYKKIEEDLYFIDIPKNELKELLDNDYFTFI